MKTFLRFLSYIITRLTIIALIIVLVVLAIFIGFDWTNINVIVNEGLAERAEVVFMNDDSANLSKFFTQDFLDRDTLLLVEPYKDFDITNYDHRVKFKKLWVWPWEIETEMIVEEIVPNIEGSSRNESDENKDIPPWKNGEKRIVVTKDGRWRISDIIMVKAIDVDKDKKIQEEKEE